MLQSTHFLWTLTYFTFLKIPNISLTTSSNSHILAVDVDKELTLLKSVRFETCWQSEETFFAVWAVLSLSYTLVKANTTCFSSVYFQMFLAYQGNIIHGWFSFLSPWSTSILLPVPHTTIIQRRFLLKPKYKYWISKNFHIKTFSQINSNISAWISRAWRVERSRYKGDTTVLPKSTGEWKEL